MATEYSMALAASDVLQNNYRVLNRMYRLGMFEYPVAERLTDGEGRPLRVLVPDDGMGKAEISQNIGWLEAIDNSPPWTLSPPPATLAPGWRWSKINEAAQGLYELALPLLPQWPQLFTDTFCLPIRALALSYEIHDYLLSVDKKQSEFFVIWAGEIVPDVDGYVRANYPVEDPARRLRLTKDLIIIALCGINELYRRHDTQAYERAREMLKSVETYLHGPLRRQQKRESFGLIGLTSYLSGRVAFALGLPDAKRAFLLSTEAYANRVYQKEEARDRGEISAQEYEETRLVSLRRSALAAALGTGYLAIARSRVTEALQSVTLARGVLKQNCGQIYAAYTEFIYGQAKRALGSSDLTELKQVKRLFRRCAKVFEMIVPHSHYPCRVQVERAILSHYLAQCHERAFQQRLPQGEFKLPERAQMRLTKFYSVGIGLLSQVIEYAKVDPDTPARIRNPRMLAEAHYLRSHLHRYRSMLLGDDRAGNIEELKTAVEDAEAALKYAEGMIELECEAYVALGAAYSALAASRRPKGNGSSSIDIENGARNQSKEEREVLGRLDQNLIDDFNRLRNQAKEGFVQALKLNAGNNPRIGADCYLHLAEWGLLTPTTYPDARIYFKKYKEEVAPLVDHDYCDKVALNIQRKLDEAGRFFFVDVGESFNVEYWNSRVRDYLITETINELAANRCEEILAVQGGGGRKRSLPKTTRPTYKQKQEGRATVKSILADELTNRLGVSRATAYNWIDDHELEESLITKCETLGITYGASK
jgi:hypothetical protein